MSCPQCKELTRVCDEMYAEYVVTFYAVGADIAEQRKSGMERAKVAAEEHRLMCTFGPDNAEM